MTTDDKLKEAKRILASLREKLGKLTKQESKEAMTTEKQEKKVSVADIQRFGEKFIIPEGLAMIEAADLLRRRAEYEEAEVNMRCTFACAPLDGAHAFYRVLQERFGFVENVSEMTFFGPKPPEMRTIQVGYGKTTSIPWGKCAIPGGRGYAHTRVAQNSRGQYEFEIIAQTIRRYDEFWQGMFADIREYLKRGSIYRGKAIAVRFLRDEDDEGNPIEIVEPEFIDTDVNIDDLIFSRDVEVSVTTNLFTPISRVADLKLNGIPVKRGVLLGGPYGTGKTMAAKVASKLAEEAGVTFLYVRRANEIPQAIQFAKQYCEPAVVLFCEDIDSVTSGRRTIEMNDILNLIDGVDTKQLNLITILTTNHVEKITRAMLRPGRLDAVISIDPPDAEAVVKLLRVYGRGVIAENADLSPIGEELQGQIPAIIAETVKRAKLHELTRTPPGKLIGQLSAQSILDAARTTSHQRKLLAETQEPVEVD